MEESMTLTFVPATLKPGAYCCGDGEQQQLSPETAQQFTDDLLILAHPIRIQILTMLARRDRLRAPWAVRVLFRESYGAGRTALPHSGAARSAGLTDLFLVVILTHVD